MIDKALLAIKTRLNEHLHAQTVIGGSVPHDDKVVFVDGKSLNNLEFALNAVSILIVNIEEEKTLRRANPYTRSTADGTRVAVQPDIRLNAYLLFVSRADYLTAWSYLSHTIEYFQKHRVFDQQSTPDLDPRVERLTMELLTLDFSSQNEIWSALRVTQHPALLYKVQLLIFRDESTMFEGEVQETQIMTRDATP